MKLAHGNSNLYFPDGMSGEAALQRTKHLAVGAHQDDLEIMAYAAIEECYGNPDKWFGGIVLTDGAGSARKGPYADYSDEDMRKVRLLEQQKAAALGEYSFVAQLGYSSAEARNQSNDVVEDLAKLIAAASADVIYVHNPADKHPTHILTMMRTIEAIRTLPLELRPIKLYGVEVWRDLDWMDDREKVILRTDRRPNLAYALMALFDSQISGGKRYDLAVPGRRLANATFFEPHSVDQVESASFAMDMSPLLDDDSMRVADLVERHLIDFRQQVMDNLNCQEKNHEKS
jgi:LmbE family N-acetylglucosaminyl deacetylase